MRLKNVSSTGKAVVSGLAAAWLAVGVGAVMAQETNELVRIDFRNRIPGVVDAPVFDFDGVTPLDGSLWMAALYAGPDTNSLATVGPYGLFFLTGADAGYWDDTGAHEFVLPFLPSVGQTIYYGVTIIETWPSTEIPLQFQISSSKIYSMLITNTVMPMVGLESFKLEPERLDISVEGDHAIIQWQYLAAARYELQSTTDLRPPVSWTPIFEWSGIGGNWLPIFSVTNQVTAIPQFYRLERWR